MSAAPWLLLSIARQLEQLRKALGEPQIPGAPQIPPIHVTITPEISEPVFDLKHHSMNAQTYEEVFSYTVTKGYKFFLSEFAIAPDTSAQSKALFKVKIGGAEVSDIRLLTSYDMDFRQMQLFEGAVVSLHMKSTDGTTVACNASYNGRRVRVA